MFLNVVKWNCLYFGALRIRSATRYVVSILSENARVCHTVCRGICGDLAPARDVREGSAAAALAPACRAGEEGWPRPRLPLFIWRTAFPGALFPNHVPGGGSQLG